MNTATKTTVTSKAVSKATNTKEMALVSHMNTLFTDLSSQMGAEKIQTLLDKSETFGVFMNGAHHLAKLDENTGNLLQSSIEQSQSVTAIYVKLRNTYFDGIVSKDGVPCVDPELIKAGKKACEVHDQMLNAMAVLEKQKYLEQLAKEANTTAAKMIATADGNKQRSLFGLTVGCPTLATLRTGHFKEFKARLNRAVTKGNMTEEEAADLLMSYKVDKESKAWILTPVQAPKLSKEEQKEKEEKEKAAKLEKLINAFCELETADQVIFLQTVGTHSHDIADLIINAGKGFEAKAKQEAAKVEVNDEEADLVADFRELAREMEQIDKGNKKLTASQKTKAKKAFEEARKVLEARGIDTSKL